jgi:hypothetical protein
VLKLRVHPDAEQDRFVDAAWYDDRDPGLGDSFLKEVRSDGRRTALNGPTFAALFDLRQRDFNVVNTGAKTTAPRTIARACGARP